MLKFSYIGANGKIGKNCLIMFINSCPSDIQIDIILISSDKSDSIKKLNGLVKDLYGLVEAQNKNINFIITDNYSKIRNSDIIICTANINPLNEQKEFYKKYDNTGRLVQAIINKNMILDIADKINTYSSNSLLLLITNQVDILCSIIRNKFNNLFVIGVGGFLDSIRFRQIINERFKIKTNALMIGYHNNDMFLLRSSININFNENVLNDITQLVKDYGKIISQEQGHGSTILPAAAINQFIEAYLFNKELISCYNINIYNEKIANFYGVKFNDSLSLPIKISYREITPILTYDVLDKEKENLKNCIKNLEKDIELTNSIDNPN